MAVDSVLTLDADFIADQHAIYQRLRVEGPVRRVNTPSGFPAWLVTRYADARAALNDPRLSKDRQGMVELTLKHAPSQDGPVFATDLSEHMLNTDPPDHDRLRKLVTRAFTARRVEQLRPRVEEITAQLLDAMAEQDEVDLLRAFAFPLPITVICELLGVPEADRERFRDWSNTLVSASPPQEIAAASGGLAQYLHELLAVKREHPKDDLLSALIAARDADDRLSEPELISMAFLLLVAGHETTVNLIGNGTLALLSNPDQLAALRADPSLLPGAIEELLRYDGPVGHATFRFTAEDVEIGGVRIPAGEFVVIGTLSANRDTDRYAEPDRLDIRRDAGGHLAFGHGIHYCLGAPLARLEAEVAFRGLLDRFPVMELAVPREDLRWRFSLIMHGLEKLPLRLGLG